MSHLVSYFLTRNCVTMTVLRSIKYTTITIYHYETLTHFKLSFHFKATFLSVLIASDRSTHSKLFVKVRFPSPCSELQCNNCMLTTAWHGEKINWWLCVHTKEKRKMR